GLMASARTGWASAGWRRPGRYSTSRPASTCSQSFRSATPRARWAKARNSARRCARSRTTRSTGGRSSKALRAPHRVDLRRAFRQRPRRPALAAVLAREDFAAARRAEHALGLALVERERDHRGLRLDAHLHA